MGNRVVANYSPSAFFSGPGQFFANSFCIVADPFNGRREHLNRNSEFFCPDSRCLFRRQINSTSIRLYRIDFHATPYRVLPRRNDGDFVSRHLHVTGESEDKHSHHDGADQDADQRSSDRTLSVKS